MVMCGIEQRVDAAEESCLEEPGRQARDHLGRARKVQGIRQRKANSGPGIPPGCHGVSRRLMGPALDGAKSSAWRRPEFLGWSPEGMLGLPQQERPGGELPWHVKFSPAILA
jgi:hypothetical protein